MVDEGGSGITGGPDRNSMDGRTRRGGSGWTGVLREEGGQSSVSLQSPCQQKRRSVVLLGFFNRPNVVLLEVDAGSVGVDPVDLGRGRARYTE